MDGIGCVPDHALPVGISEWSVVVLAIRIQLGIELGANVLEEGSVLKIKDCPDSTDEGLDVVPSGEEVGDNVRLDKGIPASESYEPLALDSGHYKLLAEAGRSGNWEIPYESLNLPVLVVTGLQDRVFLDLNDVDELFARLPNARRVDMGVATAASM